MVYQSKEEDDEAYRVEQDRFPAGSVRIRHPLSSWKEEPSYPIEVDGCMKVFEEYSPKFTKIIPRVLSPAPPESECSCCSADVWG